MIEVSELVHGLLEHFLDDFDAIVQKDLFVSGEFVVEEKDLGLDFPIDDVLQILQKENVGESFVDGNELDELSHLVGVYVFVHHLLQLLLNQLFVEVLCLLLLLFGQEMTVVQAEIHDIPRVEDHLREVVLLDPHFELLLIDLVVVEGNRVEQQVLVRGLLIVHFL